jgi:hypothetical protein
MHLHHMGPFYLATFKTLLDRFRVGHGNQMAVSAVGGGCQRCPVCVCGHDCDKCSNVFQDRNSQFELWLGECPLEIYNAFNRAQVAPPSEAKFFSASDGGIRQHIFAWAPRVRKDEMNAW